MPELVKTDLKESNGGMHVELSYQALNIGQASTVPDVVPDVALQCNISAGILSIVISAASCSLCI